MAPDNDSTYEIGIDSGWTVTQTYSSNVYVFDQRYYIIKTYSSNGYVSNAAIVFESEPKPKEYKLSAKARAKIKARAMCKAAIANQKKIRIAQAASKNPGNNIAFAKYTNRTADLSSNWRVRKF